MKIFVVGNLLVEQDSLPIKLLPKLKKEFPGFKFIEFDPSEDIKDKNLIIIDTVLDIDEVKVITEIDKIQIDRVCSLHDFDLGYNLKLMKKFGMIEKVNIIGVPEKISEKNAMHQIKKIITNLSLENE